MSGRLKGGEWVGKYSPQTEEVRGPQRRMQLQLRNLGNFRLRNSTMHWKGNLTSVLNCGPYYVPRRGFRAGTGGIGGNEMKQVLFLPEKLDGKPPTAVGPG